MARVGLASATWLLAAAVLAQEPSRSSPERSPGGGQQGSMPVEPRTTPMPLRDASAPVGGNRLSPEERRQLRRDVHDAGRDLYSDRMRGRREPRR